YFTRAEFSGADFSFDRAWFTAGWVSFAGAVFSGGMVSFDRAEFSGGGSLSPARTSRARPSRSTPPDSWEGELISAPPATGRILRPSHPSSTRPARRPGSHCHLSQALRRLRPSLPGQPGDNPLLLIQVPSGAAHLDANSARTRTRLLI